MKCNACFKEGASWNEDRGLVFCSVDCRRDYMTKRWFNRNVPIGYRDTVLEKLPCKSATETLLAFDHYENEDSHVRVSNGVYLFGVTGSGKTRSAYLYLQAKLGSYYNAEDTIWLRGTQFQREVINRTRPGGEGNFDRWFESLTECELLVIDEVDKVKFTERVETEFFDLIESRTSHRQAMILISNCGIDKFCSKMSDEAGPAIARRIKETLTPIRFTT